MATTQPIYEGLLQQVMDLPAEQKLRLLEEVLQQELTPTAENSRPFLQRLDETLTVLRMALQQHEARNGAQPADTERDAQGLRALEWMRQHRKQYGGQWVALDGDRLLAAGPNAQEVYAAAIAAGVAVPMIDYLEPVDALPFIF